MFTKRIVLLILSTVLFVGITSAQKISPKELKEKGDLFYANQKYFKALPYYLKYQESKPKDLDTKLRIGICYYETNRTELAITYLTYMVQQKDPNATAFLYLAKSYHMQHQFDDAIKYYKQYLATLEPDDNQKYPVKDDIRRCAKGKKLQYSDKLALVENLGDKVNTSGDDFAPVMNPNYGNVVYFSSIRSGNEGDLQDEFGIVDTIKGTYRADIFKTMLDKGVWTAAERLDEKINTSAHDVIFDFDANGSLLYYGISKYKNFDYSNIYSKSYINDEVSDIPFKFPIEVNSGEWDADAFFFNDSILIFSSDRNGGFGGKDLYLSYRTANGKWADAVNMGETINSPYDEITPFLTNNGKDLYFSSNNVEGMGGFDIFKTTFDAKNEGWSKPMNLGMPMNSAGDDAYFRVSDDGMRGYFSSSRTSGYGGKDVYVAYFRRLIVEQMEMANVPAMMKFITGDETLPTKPMVTIEIDTTSGDEGTEPVTEPVVAPVVSPSAAAYSFPPLFYQNINDLLLSPKSVAQLNKMRDLLIKQPTLKIELTGHTDSYAPQNFNLQNSLKNTESVGQYLIANGIDENRIIIRGCGQIYPIAKDTNDDGSENKQGRILNRRVEMQVYGEEALSIVVKTEIPKISESLAVADGARYIERLEGLSYRIQIKALTQMLDDDVLIRQKDALIETTPTIDIMRYSVGLFKEYDKAEALRIKLVEEGYKDAFVVAYINGERVDKSLYPKYAKAFPDLLNFLNDK